ncbi:hypothetical protein D9757_006889 [Collybiopsis confluens]|uniref:Uncharacterized protein n=1 Tax=Collybiopsis confluens TaxID=2823264 RepID=A0A8H5HPR6_9AGAR|nr:hypothetical protein D9757_006889 [Collybiopsis confluens]
MTPDDVRAVLQVGHGLSLVLVGQIITSVFFGLYAGLSAISTRFLVHKARRSRPHQIALIIQLCLLVNAVSSFFTSLSMYIVRIQTLLTPSNPNSSLIEERIITLDKSAILLQFNALNMWSSTLNLLIGDTLVIWRAWAVWYGNKWMRWIWIVSAICNAVFIFLTMTVWKGVGGLDSNLKRAFEGSFYLLFSLTVNVLATVAIAYKAKEISTNMFGKVRYYGETRVQKILWVVVDSGVVFCLLQGVYFAMTISSSLSREDPEYSTPFTRFEDITDTFSFIVIPLYSTTVFVLSNIIGKQ